MALITSRGSLPDTPAGLTNGVWFNMWSKKLFPFDELQTGDPLYWYSVAARAIEWRSEVLRVRRFPYQSKREVIEKLALSPADASQIYLRNAPVAGFCLSYKVRAVERLSIPKPDEVRFPQQGWLRVDENLRATWPGLPPMARRNRRTAVARSAVATSNQLDNARRAWDILTRRAESQGTITYTELGQRLRMHPRPLRFVLAPIQDFCLEQRLPPLTILVVNQLGRPGAGFIAWDRDRFEEGLSEVYAHPWPDQQNPFGFAQQIESYPKLLDDLLANPQTAARDTYGRVKVRGVAQIIFRDLLLRAYGRRCAFSGCCFTQALQAAHIVRWSQCEPNARLDVRNGVLLSSVHHSLFDSGTLTLTTDYRIFHCRSDFEKTAGKFDRSITSDLHLKRMLLPKTENHRPAIEFITRHNELLKLTRHLPSSIQNPE